MWSFLLHSLLLCSINTGIVHGQSGLATTNSATLKRFTDDAGIVHTTTKENPRIICSARTALSLYQQFDISHTSIVGIYGSYFAQGSQITIEDIEKENYEPIWPEDPTPDEFAFLQRIENISPICAKSSSSCGMIDFNIMKTLPRTPDLWIYVDNANLLTGITIKAVMDYIGSPPIYISTHYDGGAECVSFDTTHAIYRTNHENCIARSLHDVIVKTNDLAYFLHLLDDNNALQNLQKDQRAMCNEASKLSAAAQAAHARGIRVMALNPGDLKTYTNEADIVVFPIDPLTDPYLRSLEEIGVPLLHPGKHPSSNTSIGTYIRESLPEHSWAINSNINHGTFIREMIPISEWFIDCPKQPTKQLQQATDYSTCNTNTYYPVDLWLMEGRQWHDPMYDEKSNKLLNYLPDRALLQEQVAYWPLNDGTISYTSVAEFFVEMTKKLNAAVRIYEETLCTPSVDVTSVEYLNRANGGLAPGQYACYNAAINIDVNHDLQCSESDISMPSSQNNPNYVDTYPEVTKPDYTRPTNNIPRPPLPNNKDTGGGSSFNQNDSPNNARAQDAAMAVVSTIVSVLIFLVSFVCLMSFCCWDTTTTTTTTNDINNIAGEIDLTQIRVVDINNNGTIENGEGGENQNDSNVM